MVVSTIRACSILVLAFVFTSYSAVFPPSITSASRGTIGVDYGLNGDNLLTPEQTVRLINCQGIKRVRIYEPRPNVIQAFANSGIDLTVGVPDEDVPKLAANLGEAFSWVTEYVLAFPSSGISTILVGNEWLSNSSNDPSLLVPAMQNIYIALSTLQLFDDCLRGIKVSTPHSFALISPSFPPSTAKFADTCVTVMRPLLDFLVKTRSSFVVNIFPYFSYLSDGGIPLDFALFQSTAKLVTDPNTELQYSNLYDLQLDATYAAIATLLNSPNSTSQAGTTSDDDELLHSDATARPPHKKQPKLPVQAGESGWGSKGGSADTLPLLFSPSKRPITQTSSSSKALTSPIDSTMNRIQPDNVSSRLQQATTSQVQVEEARCTCNVATVENAQTYNQNLIRHVLQAKGTPANPNTPISVYIFELFNEDLKPTGPEQHFGLFYPNGTAVYPITFNVL